MPRSAATHVIVQCDIRFCMNWAAINFDWNQARAFLVTATEGSLSAAARKLDLTQPTLSRQVAALERHLGVALFERVGKQLIVTSTGQDLLEHVKTMGDAAGLVSLTASGRSQEVSGLVRITASDGIATYVLPPILERLRASYPEIELDLVVDNHLRDLRRREADIAIRHVQPEQPDLVKRKVRQTNAYLYASSAWLRKHGRPQHPTDLADAVFVGQDDVIRLITVFRDFGLALRRDNFKLTSNSGVACWEMVRRGLGIGASLPEIAVTTPEVERILPDLHPISVPFWLCSHQELHTSRRIRVVFEQLAQELSDLRVE
jgi:DNA-binding transcriptional LysR family regulator